jgi:hypothetical protein
VCVCVCVCVGGGGLLSQYLKGPNSSALNAMLICAPCNKELLIPPVLTNSCGDDVEHYSLSLCQDCLLLPILLILSTQSWCHSQPKTMFVHNIIFNVAYQGVKVIELEHADVQSPYMIWPVQTSYEQQAKYAS